MLELAARLRGLPRPELASALDSREFDATGVRDLFDLAEVLLAPDSLDHVMSRLDRRHLAVLAAASSVADEHGDATTDSVRAELVRLGASAELSDATTALLGELGAALLVVPGEGRVHVPTAVSARLPVHTPRDNPARAELAAPAPPVLVSVDDVDRSLLERRAAETGLRHRRRDRRAARRARHQPARELAKGGLALPDSKRLAESSGIALEELPRLFHRADEAGLVVRDGAFWLESDLGAEWTQQSAAARWRRTRPVLARPLPAPLRELVARRSETLTATDLRDDVRWFYPAGGRWIDEGLDRLVGEAEALGPRGGGEPIEAGRWCSPATSTARRARSRPTSPRRSTRSTCSTTSRSCRPARSSPRSTRGSAGSPTSRVATSPPRIASARHP
jgi:hypothetical protein